MSSQALDGASKYLNNLLLSRGLLKDGKPIDFANPVGDTDSSDATMSKVINLVHDLVLRRDRDAEQRELFASTIHNLKAEENQRVLDLQKLQDKNVQLTNAVSTAQAQQRTLEIAAKKAEKQVKELREQMLKIKSNLDQVRAKCISDVRKREVEIEKLKNHLSGIQRGRKDAGGMRIHALNPQIPGSGRAMQNGHDISTSQWSLENETNGFLAALVDETSTENVALRKIVNDSIRYLTELTGFDQDHNRRADTAEDGIGIPGQYRKSRVAAEQADTLTPVQDLASEITLILDHCRVLLKDPSFVPIEEVQVREEEIQKLRAGWEKMADRWKEAVTMMSQWRQKVASPEDGDEYHARFEADGLSGLGAFGRSVARRPDGQPVLGAIEEEELSSLLFEHGVSHSEEQSSLVADQEGTPLQKQSLSKTTLELFEEEESDLDLAEPSRKKFAASPAKRGINLPRPVAKPLSETNANYRPVSASKSKAFNVDEDKRWDDVENNSFDEDDDFADLYNSENGRSRLPRLTVAEKLAAVEMEASEATQDLRMRQATQKRKPADRNKKLRKSSRRRSTLSPEELAQLMGA